MSSNQGLTRMARQEDLPEILYLEQHYIPSDIAYDRETLEKWFNFQPEMFRVYEENGRVTAFSIITPVDGFVREKLYANEWNDMGDFPFEHVLSNDAVKEMLSRGERADYYWSDAVAENREPPYDFMLSMIEELIASQAKLVFSTPVTDEGERLLSRRGFQPVDPQKAGKHYNYVVDVTTEKVVKRYGKIFMLWHEREKMADMQKNSMDNLPVRH